MNNAPSQRMLRVGEQIRHALAGILQRGEIIDPVLENTVVTVTEVRMSPDLKIATAFVTALGRDDMQPVVKALASHAKFLRGKVAGQMRQMRYMPEFRFRADTAFDNFEKIDRILHSPDVARDLDDGEPE